SVCSPSPPKAAPNEQGAEGLSGGSTLLARYSPPQRRSPIVGGEKHPFNPPYGRFDQPLLACARVREPPVVEVGGRLSDLSPVLRRHGRRRSRRPRGHQASSRPPDVAGRRRHLDLALLPLPDGRLRLRRLRLLRRRPDLRRPRGLRPPCP